jgi:hypothetical protein
VSTGTGTHGHGERCTVTALAAIYASSTSFLTESYWDYVQFPPSTTQYSGTVGPENVAMAQGATMTWYSDGNTAPEGGGFVICGIAVLPPHAPPPPPSPPVYHSGREVVVVTAVASGTVESFNQDAFRDQLARSLSVSASLITLEVIPASVNIQVTIVTPGSVTASSIANQLSNATMNSAIIAAGATLQSMGEPSVVTQSSTIPLPPQPPPPSPPVPVSPSPASPDSITLGNTSDVIAALSSDAAGDDLALGVGLGVGIPVFLLIVLGVVLCLRNKKGAHQTKGTMIKTGISAQPVSMVVGGASASSEEKGRDAVVVSSVEIQMTTENDESKI